MWEADPPRNTHTHTLLTYVGKRNRSVKEGEMGENNAPWLRVCFVSCADAPCDVTSVLQLWGLPAVVSRAVRRLPSVVIITIIHTFSAY